MLKMTCLLHYLSHLNNACQEYTILHRPVYGLMIMKSLDPFRAKKIFIRKKLCHTSVENRN